MPKSLPQAGILVSKHDLIVSHPIHSLFTFLRSPPRPSPGGLHYSDEDICNKYNGAVLTEGLGLNEKPLEVSESEVRVSLCLTKCCPVTADIHLPAESWQVFKVPVPYLHYTVFSLFVCLRDFKMSNSLGSSHHILKCQRKE